jgi:hypothetical protein
MKQQTSSEWSVTGQIPRPVVRTSARPDDEATARPARVACMLALAHHLQRAIDEGGIPDRSEAARRLGLTTARVTQVLDLLLLAPRIQEQLLQMRATDAIEPITERELRSLCRVTEWTRQEQMWNERFT